MVQETVVLLLGLVLIWSNLGFGQICKFHHLSADCYYRIDQISLSHIQATIHQCEDPVQLQLTITNGNPKVHWTETFDQKIERKPVPGFDNSVFIIVQLGYDASNDNKFHIDVDFVVEGVADRIDFIDEQKKLITEGCIVLTQGAKIAVGVLTSVFVLAFTAVIVVVVLRRRQLRIKRNQAANELVPNAQIPSETDPPGIRVENCTDNNTMGHVTSMSNQSGGTVNNHITSNGVLSSPYPSVNNTSQVDENQVVIFSNHVSGENSLNC